MVSRGYGESLALFESDYINIDIDLGSSRGQEAFSRKEGRCSQ